MTRAQAGVAALAMAAMFACLYLIIEAGRRIYFSIGPSKAVAAEDGRLFLASHGAIHVFGTDGRRQARFDLGELGATLTPSDFAVHRDGRVVVANPDGSELVRCRTPSGPCEHLDLGLKRVPTQAALPLNSVKVWIDDDRGRYYVSDNAGHRLAIADFAGRVLARSNPHVVFFPNQLRLTAPDELTVVDTNHQRVATFAVTGDRFGRLLRELPTATGELGREGRQWPFDAVRAPNGDTWVLVAAELMKDADLVVFDAGGKALRRIDLGDTSDPFDIELWRNQVLVSDATNYRIDAVGLDGKLAHAFDDAEFDRELVEAGRWPQYWRAIRVGAQVGVVVFPLLGIIALKKLGVPGFIVPRPIPTAFAPARLDSQPHWIGVDPRISERARRKALPMLGFVVLALGVSAYVFYDALVSTPRLVAQVMLIGFVVILAIVVKGKPARVPRQFKDYRLGASTQGLHYQQPPMQGIGPRARGGVIPWTEVYYDGRRILAGRVSLPIVNPVMGELFDPDEFGPWIAAHIPPANLLTPDQLTIRAMRAAGPGTWIAVALLVVVLAGIAWWITSL